MLRDDLIVELAKRGKHEVRQIRAIRGMDWRRSQQALPQIAECIRKAKEAPPPKEGRSQRADQPPQLNMLGQFLSTALACICRGQSISPQLVGTAQDVRELILYHLGLINVEEEGKPVLAEGWRAEIVGQQIEDLLDGKLALRITDPEVEQPLSFQPWKD